MSDNKTYYYMKIKENFFDSDSLIVLENMPDGYLYSNILVKLYLRSLKNDGRLMLNNAIPYNSNMLAQIVRHNVGVIEKAIDIFQKLGLIEVLDNGAIYMLEIQNFIGRSSSEADRKKIYRSKIEIEKSEALPLLSEQRDKCPDKFGTNVRTNLGHVVDKRAPEIELEIETELEIKEKNNKKEKNKFLDANASADGLKNNKSVFSIPVSERKYGYFDYSGFNDQERAAIDMWFNYRKEAKKPYKAQSSLTALRNKMLELKITGVLTEAINHSIAAAYTGLFAPNNTNNPIQSKSVPKKSCTYVHNFSANKPVKQIDTF